MRTKTKVRANNPRVI